jgi:hypothetical protein
MRVRRSRAGSTQRADHAGQKAQHDITDPRDGDNGKHDSYGFDLSGALEVGAGADRFEEVWGEGAVGRAAGVRQVVVIAIAEEVAAQVGRRRSTGFSAGDFGGR